MSDPYETVQCDACCGRRPRWQFHDCQPQLKQAREENARLTKALEAAKDALEDVKIAMPISEGLTFEDAQLMAETALSEINNIMGGGE